MMQMDPASAARHANGTFLNRHQGGAPASRGSLQHARWGNRHVPLRLHNSPANLLTGVLLLGSVAPGTGLPGPVAAGRRVAPGAADAASAPVALLPAAQASGRYAPVAGPRQAPGCGSLGSIANGVAAACVARPRSCGGIMALGALAAVGGLAYAGVAGSATASRYAPVRAREEAQQDALQDTVAAAEVLADDGIPVQLEAALLQIARNCGGDRRCRADAINALLLQVPPATLTQLRQIVARTVPAAQTQQHGAWPLPGAMAAPWIPESALLDLAATLADLYTPAVAAFQDDMEAMVGATVGAGDGRHASDADIRQRWFDANARRQDAIAALLVRDAGPVERLPYALHGLEHLGIADGTEAFNLHVSLPAASTPPTQRVLLVAHGDMIGRALGSEGAYDNASGVATLLHIARQWQAAPSNAGIQLELLVTSHEELGFLGARAYVNDCLQHESCPTFVINVDMTGRGGRGYAISGTGDLAGRPHLGKPTMYLQAPPVSDTEQHARRQLEARLAARGFTAPAAADAPWITSDNIAFQNASIPCVGLSQVGADDARQWKQLETARKAWQQRDAEVDWTRWEAQQDGSIQLSPDDARALDERYQASAAAYYAYQDLRDAHPNAPPVLIHGARDRLHRVNPAMGVDFADALLDGIGHLQWQTATSVDAPAPSDR
jgi:Zn-dependent M28 family amino/carboxypeptidase